LEIKSIGDISLGKEIKKANSQDFVESFQKMLGDSLNKVNTLQSNADEMLKKLAAGEVKDIHDVMIAVEKAGIAFQLTMQIRNRVIEAYQEIMRMQI
jgi:flagellar hook-basal body complex protein FliE